MGTALKEKKESQLRLDSLRDTLTKRTTVIPTPSERSEPRGRNLLVVGNRWQHGENTP